MSERVVAAVGMFDGVHLGHQSLVADVVGHARQRDAKAAIFTFEFHPRSIISPSHSPRLLTTVEQRCQYLLQAGADEVHVLHFDEYLRQLSAQDFMRKMHAEYGVDMLVLGFNHRFGHDRLTSLQQYQQAGVGAGVDVVQAHELVLEGGIGAVSSSAVRRSLANGRIEIANQMLGRPFALLGTIGHGQAIGRTIGYPTANVEPVMQNQQVPKSGVYVGFLDAMPAMVNIGHRPTLGLELDSTIEAHVIGYEGDLYGRKVELQFVERLRDERKFDSLDSLRAQLDADRTAANKIIEKLKHTD